LARIVATREFVLPRTATHPAHKWQNLNALIERYPGATGIKTGWTEWSGPCLVASATQDDRHLLVVLLNAPAMFEGAAALFYWGYSLALKSHEGVAS
jgi:D-alanyl-D-alanine carboxypeptidase